MDLMFPHHENELAQSESATGKPFVKYWMHNGLTQGQDQGGQRRVADRGHARVQRQRDPRPRSSSSSTAPELLRYLLLSTHYRRPIEFTERGDRGRRRRRWRRSTGCSSGSSG